MSVLLKFLQDSNRPATHACAGAILRLKLKHGFSRLSPTAACHHSLVACILASDLQAAHIAWRLSQPVLKVLVGMPSSLQHASDVKCNARYSVPSHNSLY